MRKCKLGLHVLCLLGAFALAPRVQGQWLPVKGSLQKDVQITEETERRIVLYNEAENVGLVITVSKEADSDIYGGLELKRGGNPYRVWVITEKYWQKFPDRRNVGAAFFRASFLITLQAEADLTNPASVSPLPEMTKANAGNDSTPAQTFAERATKANALPEAEATTFAVAESVRVPQPEHVLPPSPSAPAPLIKTSVQSAKVDKRKEKALYDREVWKARQPRVSAQVGLAPESTTPELTQDNSQKLSDTKQNDTTRAVTALDKASNQKLAEPRSVVLWPEIRGKISSFVYYTGALVAFLVFPVMTLFAFSSVFRARLCIWRDDYDGAMRIYERALERRPHKIKFNAALANLYLRLGRSDERAMNVYKTILQLNIKTSHREKINAIVAQQLLAEGRTDSDAIEILEKALNSELLRQNRTDKK